MYIIIHYGCIMQYMNHHKIIGVNKPQERVGCLGRGKGKERETIYTLDSPDKWGRVVLEPLMVHWVVPQVGDWS